MPSEAENRQKWHCSGLTWCAFGKPCRLALFLHSFARMAHRFETPLSGPPRHSPGTEGELPDRTPLIGGTPDLNADPSMAGWVNWRNSLVSTGAKRPKGGKKGLGQSSLRTEAAVPPPPVFEPEEAHVPPMGFWAFLGKEVSWGNVSVCVCVYVYARAWCAGRGALRRLDDVQVKICP